VLSDDDIHARVAHGGMHGWVYEAISFGVVRVWLRGKLMMTYVREV
jgi:hypothetical protein